MTDSITTPPEVAIAPIALEGQPATDKGYVTPSGTRIRVRVVPTATQATVAPTNGDAQIAPSGWTISLSLAVLTDDDQVATDDAGRLLIMDRRELTISDVAMTNPAFDAQAFVETAIRQEAYRLEQRLQQRRAALDYLASQWGVSA